MKVRTQLSLTAVLVWIISSCSANALITYPGSWPTLQGAINAASPGEEVRIVDGGVHSGNLTINKNLTLSAVPSGTRVQGTVSLSGAVNITIRGIRVDPNAVANGIVASGATTLTLDNCAIARCHVPMPATSFPAGHVAGHGVYLPAGGSLKAIATRFSDNHMNAIFVSGSAVVQIERCQFDGGVLGFGAGNALVKDGWADSWDEPSASLAYIVLNNVTQSRIVNCLMVEGRVGIRAQGSPSVDVFNNTFVHPNPGFLCAVWVRCASGESPKVRVRNCIVDGYSDAIYTSGAAGQVTSDNNLLAHTTWTYFNFIRAGSNDWTGLDPMFVNSAGGDYRLKSGSPAADSGADVGVRDDLDGNARLGLPDRGAYESSRQTMSANVRLESNARMYAMIQDAMNAAQTSDTVTLMAAGDYGGALDTQGKNLTLRNGCTNPVTVRGPVSVSGGTIGMEGLTINPARVTTAMTIAAGANVTLRRCVIRGARGYDREGPNWHKTGHLISATGGAGLTVLESDLDLKESICGIYAGDNVRLTVRKSRFMNGLAAWANADVPPYCYMGHIVMENNSSALIENSTLDGCENAIRVMGNAAADVRHCTIRGMDPTGIEGLGAVSCIRLHNNAGQTMNVSVRNCILVLNWYGVYRSTEGSANVTADWNVVHYYGPSPYSGIATGAHDFLLTGDNPALGFGNETARDFRLTTASPAVNRGTVLGVADDLRSWTRDASPDCGAYEYNGDGTLAVYLVSQSRTYTTIQDAIGNAATSDTIRIILERPLAGSVNTLGKNLVIENATRAEARIESSMQLAGGVVALSGLTIAPNAIANGVTISGGANVTMRNCRISGCQGEGTSAGGWHNQGHCIVALTNSSLTISDTTLDLTGGQCGIYAGQGVQLSFSRVRLTGATAASHDTDLAPGCFYAHVVAEANTSAKIDNSLFWQGTHPVRILNGGKATISFCTIWTNATSGSAVWTSGSGTPTLSLSNSTLGGDFDYGVRNTAAASVQYSGDYNIIALPRTASFYVGGGITPGAHDKTSRDAAYLRFVDAVNGDFRLPVLSGSPAIGAANPAAATEADLTLLPRPAPAGTNADIGCYEDQTAKPGEVLKAQYGFAEKTVSPSDIGLGPKEVIKLRVADSVDWAALANYKGTTYYDEMMLKEAVQGMVNRSAPMIWLDNNQFGFQNGTTAWEEYYTGTHGYTFTQINNLQGLLTRTTKVFNGIVLYDVTPSDNMMLAMNLANLNFCLPVSRRLYLENQALFFSLPIVLEIRNNVMDRTAMYDWMIANLFPVCDRTLLFSNGSTFEDICVGDDWRNHIFDKDYPFYRKGFMHNLSCLYAQDANPVMPLDGTPAMRAHHEELMAGLAPHSPIFGWLQPESEWCRSASRQSHYIHGSPVSLNLSFHAAVQPLVPPPYKQSTKPRIRVPANKVYLAVYSHNGDSMVQPSMYTAAWTQPERGQVPLTYGIANGYVKLFPAMIEYFFRTKSDSDYFAFGIGGTGYEYPMYNGDLDGYLSFTSAVINETTNLREVHLWLAGMPEAEKFAQLVPQLRGISLSGAGPKLEFTNKRRVPVFTLDPKCDFWMSPGKGDFIVYNPTTYRFDVTANFTSYIENIRNTQTLPAYVPICGLEENMTGGIARYDAAMDHTKYEFVDYGTLMHLAGLPAGTIEWKPEHIQTLSVWSEKWNGAVATAGSSGLRLEIGAGKTWAVAAIPNLLLPENGTDVRVRVPSKSSGAAWAVKLSGDWDQTGAWVDWIPFGVNSTTGEQTTDLDPKVIFDMDRRPLAYLQMAVQGNPGDYVVFEFLDFDSYNLHAPSFTGAETLPVPAVEGTTLYVHTTGWFDADGDAENYRYAWRKNGVVIAGAIQATLAPANFQAGDSIRCAVTAWDGVHEGNTVQTTTVRVIQSAGVTDWNYR